MRLRTAICAGIVAALGIGPIAAHDHEHSSKKKQQHHEDHGRHLAKGHHKLDDRDRDVTRTWCHEHRDRLPVGFRDIDRLPPQLDARLQVGVVLDLNLRMHVHPLPTDLVHRLPAPPAGIKYVAIGGHVGLLDGANRLHDLLPRPPFPF